MRPARVLRAAEQPARARRSAPFAPPHSVSWRINREVVVLLGYGRAILLQLAHPLVAAGVADYSTFRQTPAGYLRRVHGTIGAMLALTFGTETDARAAAGRINAIHDQVTGTLHEPVGPFAAGTPYSARDPELLRWVHATLIESVLLAYEVYVGRLPPGERDRYCAETAAVTPLFGMPEWYAPDSAGALDAYMRRMYASGAIVVSGAARRLARDLLAPPVLGIIAWPVLRIARLATVGLLPADVRQGYDFPWTPHHERALRRSVRLVRRVRAVLPRRLREWPAARAAGR